MPVLPRSIFTMIRPGACLANVVPAALVILMAGSLLGQPPATQPVRPPSAADRFRSDYVLGAFDRLSIRTSDIEETERTVRISEKGAVHLPMAGTIQAAGMTIEQFQNTLIEKLKPFVRQPQVWVDVIEFHSQPVSITGAVRNPGVYQLEGRKSLVEMLSMAGGVREDAGSRIRLTRRPEFGKIPAAGATQTGDGTCVAEVRLKAITESAVTDENLEIKPHDIIAVPRAQMVFAVGEVKKSGGFMLAERETLSVLQVLSFAEGLTQSAAPGSARILRKSEAPERSEIAVDLQKILKGKSRDVLLAPDDILFVPNATG